MGSFGAEPLDRLIQELTRLPGVGEKTAARFAFFILRQEDDYATRLSQALEQLREGTRLCETCFNISGNQTCRYCSDSREQTGKICVVEEPHDVMAIERSGGFEGRYHVLHGVLSPLDGIGPDQLKVKELLQRVSNENIKEIVLALNPSVEGDATAMYIARLIKPLGVQVTKIAHGIPMGGDLEYIDGATISRAIENRMQVE
jgi:recombination protein RecR